MGRRARGVVRRRARRWDMRVPTVALARLSLDHGNRRVTRSRAGQGAVPRARTTRRGSAPVERRHRAFGAVFRPALAHARGGRRRQAQRRRRAPIFRSPWRRRRTGSVSSRSWRAPPCAVTAVAAPCKRRASRKVTVGASGGGEGLGKVTRKRAAASRAEVGPTSRSRLVVGACRSRGDSRKRRSATSSGRCFARG